jgi:hypothetical protein
MSNRHFRRIAPWLYGVAAADQRPDRFGNRHRITNRTVRGFAGSRRDRRRPAPGGDYYGARCGQGFSGGRRRRVSHLRPARQWRVNLLGVAKSGRGDPPRGAQLRDCARGIRDRTNGIVRGIARMVSFFSREAQRREPRSTVFAAPLQAKDNTLMSSIDLHRVIAPWLYGSLLLISGLTGSGTATASPMG